MTITLLEATRFNQTVVMAILLDHGADVNARGDRGFTPLHYAVAGNQTKSVELLLAHGADVNAADDGGWLPLYYAVKNGFGEVVQRFLDSSSSLLVNAPLHNVFLLRPLHFAAKESLPAIARLLLDRGASLEVKARCPCEKPGTPPSVTPLHFAAMNSYTVTEVNLTHK
jgi:cytohesin